MTPGPAGGGGAPAVLAAPDPFDRRWARGAPGALAAFNLLGVLDAADVHVATRLAALAGEEDEAVLLGAALAVRALRLGHVCTDLATVRTTATAEGAGPAELGALPWPAQDGWRDRLAASPVVAVGDRVPPAAPLRLVGSRLYLDRYWRQECEVAADLLERSRSPVPGVAADVLAAGLDRLFPGPPARPGADGPDLQRLAAAVAVLRRFAVVGGGPGTGKTTTVARILALLDDQAAAAGAPPPRVALAAPTGKAAARLEEAVHAEAGRIDAGEATRRRLLALEGSTLHRLLGWRPDSRSRFRHHRGNRLPHDVVVVDETSMVSLSLMAKLVEAVRPAARLVLLGDPEQLASVEAGAVLGDIVGPAAAGPAMAPEPAARLAEVTGEPVAGAAGAAAVGASIVVLRRVHRYGGAIAELAGAVQAGDADAAVAVLAAGRPDVAWVAVDVAAPGAGRALDPVRRAVVEAGAAVAGAASRGDAAGALAALGALRVLCAHRQGPYGAGTWMATVEGWLAAAVPGYGAGGRWYTGRPLLVTENDYGLRLYNGDTGVVVAADGRTTAVFERGGRLLEIAPTRLGAVESVHAMTVHKSQGSQFDAVVLLLPEAASPILTRELLYTGLTRARSRLTVVGTEESVRAAVGRPVARASGLRDRLWDAADPAG